MKRHTLVLGALAATALTTALAAPLVSPQRIIVNPVPTELKVDTWVNKTGTDPDYRPGEQIKLYVKVTQDAYIYLFNVGPDGTVDMVLPNKYAGGGNFVKANTTKVFPDTNDQFTFDIAAPYGRNKVLALASKTQLDLNTLARFEDQQSGFASVNASGQKQLAQKLSIIVKPIPQDKWITDTAFYDVVR
ncbi:DUF4384 domain-containing protein [Deinococcus cellulosilyticus]|uniref:DUF4384 domain-containing protein n=1 Tax=Deinococcus cellulosilyticus (strain DSM 18568 / NBRC 106333 / KACC 11606 / 5516J-15) TaxID=1223518 RepID=A0A511N9H8_DEIC1|nr:DUF4384 domain-containing protein [Deinococcus cellulosilyticus]GEM49207.1 hypothetical protein DC3_48420 [Deinococcus cellulosilyticus NBRC 106333 = KACC 11606]